MSSYGFHGIFGNTLNFGHFHITCDDDVKGQCAAAVTAKIQGWEVDKERNLAEMEGRVALLTILDLLQELLGLPFIGGIVGKLERKLLGCLESASGKLPIAHGHIGFGQF